MRDERTMDFIAARKIPLDVCPTSNLRTGALARQIGRPTAGYEQHPLPSFLRRGLPVTISSDDPAMFETTVSAEYSHMQRMGLTPGELVRLAEASFQHSFLPPRTSAPCSPNFIPALRRWAWYNALDESTCMGHAEAHGPRSSRAGYTACPSSLGFSEVRDVRQGKFFVLDLDGVAREAAEKQVERMAREILANPVIEEFRYEIVE